MANESKGNLASALASLILEEMDIRKEIRILQEKLERIQTAKEHIENVHEGRTGSAGENYSNLTARNAIRMYLKEQGKPLAAPEIARGITERGFKSKAKNFVNMVGVILRGYEGADFKRTSDNRWTLA